VAILPSRQRVREVVNRLFSENARPEQDLMARFLKIARSFSLGVFDAAATTQQTLKTGKNAEMERTIGVNVPDLSLKLNGLQICKFYGEHCLPFQFR
jgi:hypothetical protein